MAIYIVLFALAIILGIPLAGRKSTNAKKIVYLSVIFGFMLVMTVLRYGIGNDYFSYIRIFQEINLASWGELLTLGYEPLFALITKLITLFSANPEVMYGIYAVLILAPVAYSIYRHSDNVWLSVTVYLCLTFFYTSLNFIRQSMSVSIIILAYGFIKEKKLVPALIMAVAAMTFHYTAAVFIPLFLLAFFLKPTKKSLIIYGSISVGTLIICLVMKAMGANPLNLLANLVTAITGKNYDSYVGSKWFEVGFGPEYLIMPLAVAAVVLICYFLGWKDKKESDALLWLMLENATIWTFITYAFIVERFSMFIFIFAVFAIPSALAYFSEKADLAEIAAQEAREKNGGKKKPGYSSSKAEEKSDNIFIATVVVVAGMFVYNCWGMYKNFHGVFPYMCGIPAVQDALDGHDTSEENLEIMYTNADLYTYLVQLKNADCGYIIISTATDYDGFIPGIRRAADYAGTGLNRASDFEAKAPYYLEYNNRSGETHTDEFAAGEISYTAENGITVKNSGTSAVVSDSNGTIAEIGKERLMFVLFNENGIIFDATQFGVDTPSRDAEKVIIE